MPTSTSSTKPWVWVVIAFLVGAPVLLVVLAAALVDDSSPEHVTEASEQDLSVDDWFEPGGSYDFGMSEPGWDYGDNEVLDRLWDRCDDGSGSACDDLYWKSEFGSEYEEFGGSCGRRIDFDLYQYCVYVLGT